MNKWIIDRNSTSFRFLSRWHIDYKHSDHMARDFCTYYKTVILTIAKLTSIAFLLAVCVPAFIMEGIFNMGVLNINIGSVSGYFTILILALGFITVMAIIAVLLAATICKVTYFAYCLKHDVFKDKQEKVRRARTSIIREWLSSRKHKYCKLVEYK